LGKADNWTFNEAISFSGDQNNKADGRYYDHPLFNNGLQPLY